MYRWPKRNQGQVLVLVPHSTLHGTARILKELSKVQLKAMRMQAVKNAVQLIIKGTSGPLSVGQNVHPYKCLGTPGLASWPLSAVLPKP